MVLEIFGAVSLKRARDDNDDELEQTHQAKRPIRSLPFRVSPTTTHTRLFSQSKRSKPRPLFTQTLTPADSEEENSPPYSTLKSASTQAHPERLIEATTNDALDADMDMLDTMMLSPKRDTYEDMAMISPSASPRTTDAAVLHDSANTGRLPTPIYGHFQSSVVDMLPGAVTIPAPSKSEGDLEHEQYLRSRRLPSPISEDEAMDFPPAPENSPLETSAPIETYQTSPRGLRTPVRLAQPLSSQPSTRGKIMFAMGFRADCEMCRNRVPGHSNHIYRV